MPRMKSPKVNGSPSSNKSRPRGTGESLGPVSHMRRAEDFRAAARRQHRPWVVDVERLLRKGSGSDGKEDRPVRNVWNERSKWCVWIKFLGN